MFLTPINDPHYFTAQADATHFSGCKGKITSINGLYEGMMDDAINVHGTYLKVTKRVDDNTLVARYMHGQSYGFEWGYVGDAVQFVKSNTMELVGSKNEIVAINAIDKPTVHGTKEFEIKFKTALDERINENNTCGIENLEWTPEVYFANNTIRNNRTHGALFSTPKPTLVENNVFETFDSPIVYAKSVDGLIFRNNEIKKNNDYPAFHWNKKPFFLERVINATVE